MIKTNIAKHSIQLAITDHVMSQAIDDKTGLLDRDYLEHNLKLGAEHAHTICNLWAIAELEGEA